MDRFKASDLCVSDETEFLEHLTNTPPSNLEEFVVSAHPCMCDCVASGQVTDMRQPMCHRGVSRLMASQAGSQVMAQPLAVVLRAKKNIDVGIKIRLMS